MSFPASIAYSIIETAASCIDGALMESSARLTLSDARTLFDEGKRFDYAAGRALHSLSYSRGVFSKEYRAAALMFEDARS